MASLNLGLPFVSEGQAQPHITHNEALDLLDASFPRVARSASLTVPPAGSLAEGSCYIVPPAAAWPGFSTGDIALRHGGAWHRITPARGWRWLVADEGAARVWDGDAWRIGDVLGALGSRLGLVTAEADLAGLSGAFVTAADLLPARAIILGVSSWVISAVTGASAYSVGVAGDPARFGGSLGVVAGSSNVGVVGPFATYSPGDVIVTASGGAFTGGRVGLAVAAILPGVPV